MSMLEFEESDLRPFHLRVVLSGSGGQLSDGYVLGIIGITLGSAVTQLHLSSGWIGILGASSLLGLLAGAILAGPLVDRIGRRPIFVWDMAVFSLCSVLQFFVTSAQQLLALRLLLGLTLGADYVAGKALVTEYCPIRVRGRLLSVLAVSWAAGYTAAYCVGFALRDLGPDAWRWMLLSSAIPSALVFPARVGIPESPLWLANKGRNADAAAVVATKLGTDVAAPRATALPTSQQRFGWSLLFSRPWRSHTVVACVFYTCQVIPFFALGTFMPRVLAALHVRAAYLGGLVYTLFLLGGAILGLIFVDRISRRQFLIGGFYACAALLAVLAGWPDMPPTPTVGVFAVFAALLAAAANLEYVYTPELFPTQLRATGVGLAVASSRLGASAATALLPLVQERLGIHAALIGYIVVLLIGGILCQRWAPETGSAPLTR